MIRARRLALFVAPLAAAAAVCAGTGSATKSLTIYAVATHAQYADHSDDRQRGDLDNPFDADGGALAGGGKNSHVGDNALFSFKLYSDAKFKHQIGSASYSCTVTAGKMALCEADYELSTGAIIATGPADFDSSSFTIAVNGGTGKYLGARGQVSSAPAAANAHRLTFTLR